MYSSRESRKKLIKANKIYRLRRILNCHLILLIFKAFVLFYFTLETATSPLLVSSDRLVDLVIQFFIYISIITVTVTVWISLHSKGATNCLNMAFEINSNVCRDFIPKKITKNVQIPPRLKPGSERYYISIGP